MKSGIREILCCLGFVDADGVEARSIVRENRKIAQIIMPSKLNKGEKSEGQKPINIPQEARP